MFNLIQLAAGQANAAHGSNPRRKRLAAASALTLGLACVGALAGGSAHAADLCDNTNTAGVTQGALRIGATNCFFPRAAHLTQVSTYHWNNSAGAQPGTITLMDMHTGRQYGPFPAAGSSGQNGARNVNWTANVNIDVPANTELAILDSGAGTHSYNSASTSYGQPGGNYGFVKVEGDWTSAASSPSPFLPPAPPAPPPSGGSILTHTPCHANSASMVEMAKPVCSGPPGTTLTLYVSRYGMTTRPTVAYFRSGATYNQFSLQNGGAANTPGLPSVFSAPLTLSTGNGLEPNSTYTFTIPPGACFSGPNHTWWFDIWVTGNGDVDSVPVRC